MSILDACSIQYMFFKSIFNNTLRIVSQEGIVGEGPFPSPTSPSILDGQGAN
jgi:hypothetical protein